MYSTSDWDVLDLPPAVDTLSVVVHVIHTRGAIGSPFNPTDNQIQAMITSVNNAYKKMAPPMVEQLYRFFYCLRNDHQHVARPKA
ncbi:MAG: hypothetical protein ABJC12_00495 [Saprospiraceae bacterium]